jgi:trk system potassium uptake protein TrkH
MSSPRTRTLSTASARGALLATAPAPAALVGWWYGLDPDPAPWWAWGVAIAMGLAFVYAGFVLPTNHTRGRIAASVGLLGIFPAAGSSLFENPALFLFLAMGAIVAYFAIDRTTDPGTSRLGRRLSPSRLSALAARGAAIAALLFWVASLLMGKRVDERISGVVALSMTMAIPFALTIRWAVGAWRSHRWRILLLLLACVVAGVWLWWRIGPPATSAHAPTSVFNTLASLLAVIVAILPGRRQDATEGGFWDPVIHHPERLLVTTFLLLCLAGTLLLALPVSSADGRGIPVGDAAFTAVSSVCVTGLAVVDTGTAFSGVGEAFLLLLIQVGGLGIMTFSTAALRVFGRRVSMRHEGVMVRMTNTEDRAGMFSATFQLILLTFAIEALGALVLFASFSADGMETGTALWKAVFTSISAFCNAGFALDGASLIPYADNPAILHTVALLIIAGGLSPAAIIAVPRIFGRSHTLSVQVRAVFIVTAGLLILGFIGYLTLEWNRTLAGMDFDDRVHNAWFQSVTFRTAGFNSTDLAATGPVTYLMMLALMLVGGSPGGTAGGIRTTTVLVLLLAVVAAIRNRPDPTFGSRTIAHTTIYKAAAVATVMVGLVFGATAALMLTQSLEPKVAIFEVVSALATVGLSIGGTSELDGVGRGIIMACMFLGRVGALTLFMFLAQRERVQTDPWRLPEGHIQVI